LKGFWSGLLVMVIQSEESGFARLKEGVALGEERDGV